MATRADNDTTRNDATESLNPTEPLEDAGAATTRTARDDEPEAPDIAATPRVQAGSLLRERFLLQEEVNAGGMGIVYRALDRQLADTDGDSPSVAVKVLSPKFARNSQALRALQQEASKIRCLTHPHIVRFIDFDRDGDQYFLVMEWLEGRTLANILDSADAMNIDRVYALRVARQIGDALDYAHRCGIVHADVKPGNVMILPNGDAKLFDFGIARVRQAESPARFDPKSLHAATPAYASMQVLTGESPVPADDVFSLACLLYRLIAGYRVFGPRNAADASQEGMTPQRPQGFTDAQWSAMRKALSYSRVTRFAAMDEFVTALAEEADTAAATSSLRAPDLEWTNGRSKLPIAAALLLVGAAGVAISDRGSSWLQSFADPAAPAPVVAAQQNDAIAAVPAAAAPVAAPPAVTDVADEPGSQVGTVETARVALADNPPAAVDLPKRTVAAVAPDPINTIAVTADAVRVRESESAVQIDIARAGSIQLPLTIGYTITGITATEGLDFFAPASNAISFATGQDTVRVLIPLVQDSAAEGDEQFMLRLKETTGISGVAGRQTTLVTILDDEPQTR